MYCCIYDFYPLYIYLACDSDVETSATYGFGSPPSDVRLRVLRGCSDGNTAVETGPAPILGHIICAAFRRLKLCDGERRRCSYFARRCRKGRRTSQAAKSSRPDEKGSRNTIVPQITTACTHSILFTMYRSRHHGCDSAAYICAVLHQSCEEYPSFILRS